jgi:hypothetical protein
MRWPATLQVERIRQCRALRGLGSASPRTSGPDTDSTPSSRHLPSGCRHSVTFDEGPARAASRRLRTVRALGASTSLPPRLVPIALPWSFTLQPSPRHRLPNSSPHVAPCVAQFLRVTDFNSNHHDRRPRPSRRGHTEERPMNLVVWLPAMFFLGLASMALFAAFVAACDRI